MTTVQIIQLGSILFLLALSAFFSGSETALTAASRARMHSKEKEGDKRAGLVGRLLESRERLIGALLLGNNIVNILASTLMASLMLELFGPVGVVYATGVMTVLILIFAEVMPKTYAITNPDTAALKVVRPVNIIVKIFAPVVHVVQIIVNSLLRFVGVGSDANPYTAADEIRGAVDLHHQEGGVAKRARDQIMGVLAIGDLTVEDVMIHRKNVEMIDVDLPAEQIVKLQMDSGHTRLPLYKNDKDNVVGVLHAKDILRAIAKSDGDFSTLNIRRLARAPWFVPETTSVVKQLRLFQQKREHFALAVDEYGALMGVVTLEDILEEIVGDIKDEYDTALIGMEKLIDGGVKVQGDVAIRDLNRAVDWSLPGEEAITVAGLVIHESQTIPDAGQVFSFYGYRFEILQRQRNQITVLKITKTFEPDERGD